MKLRKTITVACSFLLLAVISRAADTTGQISGTVTDSSGALIANVQVLATEIDRGTKANAITDEKGKYSLLALQTGRYNLKFTANGFKTYERRNVAVDVNSALQVDAQLEVGSTVTDVVVEANTETVETVNTQLGQVIEGNSVQSLPLNGRSYTDLLGLQPGVVPESASTIDAGASYGAAPRPETCRSMDNGRTRTGSW